MGLRNGYVADVIRIRIGRKKRRMAIPNYVWVLPRPRRDHYKGSWPLHFEIKLLRLLGMVPEVHSILHPFGGKAEYGIRLDINPEVEPDIVGDAHNMDMFQDNTFDLVICDPPYNTELSLKLYGTGKVNYKKYISEAVRVAKQGGFIASYHWAMTPRPHGTEYFCRVFIGTRIWHKPRVVCIFRKIDNDY
jgi:hypothetical protein